MRRCFLSAVCAASVLSPVAAPAAPPAAPVLVAPNGVIAGSTYAFSWRASAGASWYQLWVTDATASPRFLEWYTAGQAGCGGGGICTVMVTTGLAAGRGQWWVRGWNADGNGAWSAGAAFSQVFTAPAWAANIPVADRFQLVLDGEGVLDRETGLVWQRTAPADKSKLYFAVRQCFDFTAGSEKRLGWRLPNLPEIASLVRGYGAASPGLPAGHPFLGIKTGEWYWTSSAAHDGVAYLFVFSIPSSGQGAIESENYRLCVRDAAAGNSGPGPIPVP